jgi:UDP-N-acetylglucosamine acyltransferase
MAGLTALGGHVEIGDWAILGGLAGAHQFTRIGAHAFIGGATKLTKDVPPFLLADGNPCRTRGVNVVGLRRRGFDREAIEDLRTAYRMLFKSPEMNLGQALSLLEKQGGIGPEVASLVSFIRESERGVHT